MYKIGLTGGIASGKSTATQVLRAEGAAVVDADIVAREVVAPGTQGLRDIVRAFGAEMIRRDGTLDRERLAASVFGNEENRRKLNGILHGHIKARIEEEARAFEAEGHRIVVYDIPLLVEAGWYRETDEVWLLYVPAEIQKERLVKRDGFTEAEADARIASQMPVEEKKRYADVVIDNTGTEEELRHRMQTLWRRVREAHA